jgi:hypothetical protein
MALKAPLRCLQGFSAGVVPANKVNNWWGNPPSLRQGGAAKMEHFLRDVLAMILAGVVVAWIVNRKNR